MFVAIAMSGSPKSSGIKERQGEQVGYVVHSSRSKEKVDVDLPAVGRHDELVWDVALGVACRETAFKVRFHGLLSGWLLGSRVTESSPSVNPTACSAMASYLTGSPDANPDKRVWFATNLKASWRLKLRNLIGDLP